MKFFFFETSMQPRGANNELRPTLRALPGQTFDDGSPVDPDINVQAPKDPKVYSGGTRLEYPIGTLFCSNHLEEVQTANGAVYYSIYYNNKLDTPSEFHPVSEDPSFQWNSPNHRNDAMNIALTKFKAFGDQEVQDTKTQKPMADKKKSKAVSGPADINGNARSASPDWSPAYQDQVETETDLLVIWMRRTLKQMNIRGTVPAKKDDEIMQTVNRLFSAGESVDSIANVNRLNAIMTAQRMDVQSLGLIAKGPFKWYLEEIWKEHEKKTACTAVARGEDGADDATFIISTAMNNINGTMNAATPELVEKVKKAMGMGWTVNDILVPDVLTAKDDMSLLMDDIVNGVIEAPRKIQGASFLDTIMADKKLACPKKKDGFCIEPKKWFLLMGNLKEKTNTLITGPCGTGKTEIVRRICEATGTNFTLIPMGTITDPTEQLIGKMDLDPSTNGTRFDWADFALAVQRPGVVLLDEINRCPRNGWNTLFSILDGNKTLVASGAKSTDQRVISVNPDCVFFATANLGAEYVGTSEIDAALDDRFMMIELGYLDAKDECDVLVARTGIAKEDANNIALVADNIRKQYRSNALQQSVSIRKSLMAAKLVRRGYDVEEAMEMAFLPGFQPGVTDKDPNSERGVVRAIIASRFNN
jgi:hypothetical protein